MLLEEEIGKYGSVAIAGLAKNTGKTVTLNYLLREGHRKGLRIGVTSIGVDGESLDIVTSTNKPEIRLYEGMHFATSETHFRQRKIEAEVTGIMSRHTSLGRVVAGKALTDGKILLSGPADTMSMKGVIEKLHTDGADTVLVDGALSRVSLASPAVTDALVLATGAALSPDIATILAKTAFICELASIDVAEGVDAARLMQLEGDLYALDNEGNPERLGIGTALNLEKIKERIFSSGNTIYNPGIVSDKFMRFLASQKEIKDLHLMIRDFTRLFVEPQTYRLFLQKGGRISVLKKSVLLAVTINPYSPAGFTVDRYALQDALRQRLDVPVIYIDPE